MAHLNKVVVWWLPVFCWNNSACMTNEHTFIAYPYVLTNALSISCKLTDRGHACEDDTTLFLNHTECA